MPPSKFKKARMCPEEAELWAEAYVTALLLKPDYDSQRVIYSSYPIIVECLIREKLRELIDPMLVEKSFPLVYSILDS